VETIKGEWAVLRVGVCELALHRVGKPYRVADASAWKVETNAKMVILVTRDAHRRATAGARGRQGSGA
jgi:hypothetical protein